MKKFATLAIVLIFTFYSFVLHTAMAAPHVDVDVNTAYQIIVTDRISHPNLVILDVRTVSEYEEGHIPQAVLIPVDELPQRIDELSQFKDDEIMVYCRRGGRSNSASLTLDENNFTTVFDILGGLEAWTEAGFPIEQNFEVAIENVTYPVSILTNSTIQEFHFNATLKQLFFNLTGTTATTGSCNVSIPSNLMWGDFSLSMDNISLVEGVNYTETHNGTHYLFSINYLHSSHVLEIVSTEVVPDFAEWLFMPFIVSATLATFILRKKEKGYV
jgi:rhodanese-related sulfurtransferase